MCATKDLWADAVKQTSMTVRIFCARMVKYAGMASKIFSVCVLIGFLENIVKTNVVNVPQTLVSMVDVLIASDRSPATAVKLILKGDTAKLKKHVK